MRILLYLPIIVIILFPPKLAPCSDLQTICFGTINQPQTRLYKKAFAILSHAFQENGYKFSLVHLPGRRSLVEAANGRIDGDAFRVQDLDYPGLIRVDEPVIIIDQSVWSKKKITVNGWDSVKSYRLVYERGTAFIEKKAYLFKSVQVVNDMGSVWRTLDIDRADITITSGDTGRTSLLEFHLEDSGIMKQKPPLLEVILYPYMNSKQHLELSGRLTRTLRQMKTDGTYDRLVAGVESY